MPLKVGVTTGLYTVGRDEQLANALAKVGYALTRGTSVIEIAADVAHEVTETDGVDIRHLSKKQGIDLTFHGSLTVPMCIPERGDWRDAHEHMCKSIRSAIYAGCIYTNFHSCLNIWLELLTYTSRKLTMAFCDHEGHFISRILKESKKLREWFIDKRSEYYMSDILSRDERIKMSNNINMTVDKWKKDRQKAEFTDLLMRELPNDDNKEKFVDDLVAHALSTGTIPSTRNTKIDVKVGRLWEKLKLEFSEKGALMERGIIDDTLREKLARGGKWNSEELKATVGILDGYHIMAHYMFYEKDPMWMEMAKIYKGVLDDYKLDYNNKHWLEDAWEKAEEKNDREFKEFFYGVVGAKYLEGHMKKVLEWLEGDLVKKDLKDNPELQKIARNMQICIESPDARDPSHAGLHLLWNPRQSYASIKAIRNTLKTDRVWILMDFEHVATQGLDPIKDMEEVVKLAPDFGKYVLAVHSNAPNPLHAHEPLEFGDIRVYKLLWFLRKTGMGEKETVYLIYERGGGKDPFQRSVEALKAMKKFLDLNIPPDELPLDEFYGIKGPMGGGFDRQLQIVTEHATDPMKDLLEMPEEEWTMFSQGAIKKGKKPEVIKKGEFR